MQLVDEQTRDTLGEGVVPLEDARLLWRSLCKEPLLADLVDWLYESGFCLSYSAPGWIPYELLNQTREVWSRHYQRKVSVQEAVEILKPVRRLAGTLGKVEGGRT